MKPFSPEEEAAMEEVVARMVRRLKKDVRQLKSRQARGRLSVIKTLQKNYRNGMVPFVKVLRRKRKERPRLVVLCDVSYSVSHASRFMLLLVHTLQKGLLDVRSFIFNREIAEVSSLLRTMPLNLMLELIDGGSLVSLHDNSDFGHVVRGVQAEPPREPARAPSRDRPGRRQEQLQRGERGGAAGHPRECRVHAVAHAGGRGLLGPRRLPR